MRAGGLTSLGIASTLFWTGCYQGEWRQGIEVPISATARLKTVRTVETWELSEPGNGYVLSVKGSTTPRCRHALYGKTRRTDTGTFERLGGNWWKGAAIVTGIAGGAGVGIGAGGWIAQLDPKIGPPITYAAGGAIAAGGLASCLASISYGSKARYVFCGILTGLGASILAGGALSTLPGTSSTTTPTVGGTSSSTSSASTPLITTPTFQTIAFAGGGLVGASILTGIIGHAWQGTEDRVRTVDSASSSIWDDQQPESACNAPSTLVARSAVLLIVADNVTSGPGSEERPLKVRVQPVGPGAQMVDLRWVRQALPHCGVLRVKLSPDVNYPPYSEDYTPVVSPELIGQSVRPLFTQVVPAEGVELAPLADGTRPLVGKPYLHGLSSETLKSVDRACSGEPAAPSKVKPKPAPAPVPPVPVDVVQPVDPSVPVESLSDAPPVVAPQALRFDDPGLTPGIHLQSLPEGQEDDPSCGREAQKSRLTDCEFQCSRNLLQGASCLPDYRRCVSTALRSAQRHRERSACEFTWQECLSRVGLSSSTFRSCTEACADANTPTLCRESKSQRLAP
jgi:hypothetical protein